MPFYSDELIEEVRARNDVVDVIGGYVRLQKKSVSYNEKMQDLAYAVLVGGLWLGCG